MTAPSSEPPQPDPPYRDPKLPVETRVADLLARMTRAEKLAQVVSIPSTELGLVDRAMRYVVEPGRIRVLVGTSSGDDRLAGDLALVGPVVEALNRERYLTPTRVS